MKRVLTLLAIFGALYGCTKTVKEVATEPPIRRALEIRYVAIPKLPIYAQPSEDAKLVTTYNINETVSILSKKDDWVEVRTVDGSGWAKAAGLINAEQAQEIQNNPVPRFLTPPVPVPDARAHGIVTLNAKVNTDGEVIEVKIVNNTTRNVALANANASSLLQAKFYPMVQKGQRMTFTYEYKVVY